MGVKGLLPLLKSIHKPCNLKQFSGQTLGVDAYGWLHRGTIACAIELAQGKPTTKFVDFCMHRVRMLIHFGVRPFIVFDGDYLPSKKDTEKGRASKRRASKAAGLELLQLGKTAQAYQELQKSIDVTPEMARQFMDELDKAKVDFIVAPYEADAQLVYLEKKGIIHGIISEDSDMLVFGAKSLLTKLDQYGDCVAIHRKDFTACRDLSFVGWSDSEFRWMSILSGCDYLAPIGNVGLKTAHRLIRKHKTAERTIKAIQFDGKSKVPQEYLQDFKNAELTFLYQWVYCPLARQLVNITNVPGDVDLSTMPFLGQRVDDSTAQLIAKGRLHPHTKEPLVAARIPATHPRTLERAMQASTPELKKHHSIESFFKPKRTPLAELDPNAFTPSPSQQRLLEQQAQEWPSNDVHPMPPPLTRSLTDTRRVQSARRAVSDLLPTPIATSPKRQRLGSDSAIGLAMGGISKATAEHSRFFSKPAAQSPSVLRASRKESKKAKEVNIWSDDSIEEAMSQIPDITGPVNRFAKKMQVFRDQPAAVGKPSVNAPKSISSSIGPHEARTQTETQESMASIESGTWSDREELLPGTPPTSFESEAQPQETAVAENNKQALDSIEESPQRVPCSSPPQPPLSVDDDITACDSDESNSAPIEPLSIKKEFSVFQCHKLKTAVKGSEDLLVPNSDSEEDVLAERKSSTGSAGSSGSTGFGIDLTKFAFQG
ncbi:Exodeoxyribonuclease 1 [Sphaceloma murrayae]|uniref:Exodeoxyribonuclease 1 n=1 Tax=Sphaceloma murrayae TaxID=2082308 RepID=A0A2K1R3J8_9PEZI|nr:Exodeoxyribonuclease 1 [Sphaceloma murrayae]